MFCLYGSCAELHGTKCAAEKALHLAGAGRGDLFAQKQRNITASLLQRQALASFVAFGDGGVVHGAGGDEVVFGALGPGLLGEVVFYAVHGDAVFDGADEGAEVAAYAFVGIDAGIPVAIGSEVGVETETVRAVELGDGGRGDGVGGGW